MSDQTKTAAASSYRQQAVDRRVEALARLIAAEKMDLLHDATGGGLPYDLWKQAEHLALAVMTLIRSPQVDISDLPVPEFIPS
jgi:hypothetical protein